MCVTRRGRWTAAVGEQTSWWSTKARAGTRRTLPARYWDPECRYGSRDEVKLCCCCGLFCFLGFFQRHQKLNTNNKRLSIGVFPRLCVWGLLQQHLRLCAHHRPLFQPAVLRIWWQWGIVLYLFAFAFQSLAIYQASHLTFVFKCYFCWH